MTHNSEKASFHGINLPSITRPGKSYLSLHSGEISLDGIGLGDEDGILFLVARNALFQLLDDLVHLLTLDASGLGQMLQVLQLVAQWVNTLQHVSIVQLEEKKVLCVAVKPAYLVDHYQNSKGALACQSIFPFA